MPLKSLIRRSILLASALVLARLLAAPGSLAQGAVVRFAPAQAAVGAGQTAAVEVWVDDVTDLYGLDIQLSFDPVAVQVVDADALADGIQVRPGDLLKPDLVIRNTVDNDAGTVWFSLTQINPTAEVSGSGVACVILFEGLQQGAAGPLTVVEATLAARNGQAIAATLQAGEIAVVSEEQAPPTPTPAPTLPPPTLVLPTPEPTPTSTPTPLVAPSHTPDSGQTVAGAPVEATPASTAEAATATAVAASGQAWPAGQPSLVPAASGSGNAPSPFGGGRLSLWPFIALAVIALLLAGLIWYARRRLVGPERSNPDADE